MGYGQVAFGFSCGRLETTAVGLTAPVRARFEERSDEPFAFMVAGLRGS
jgi:hypothetical protein